MNLVRAELTKLWTLRSTAVTLAAALAVGAALSLLVSSSLRSADDDQFDALFAAFYGLTVAQIALVVFAVLAIGSEYRSGTIRAALAAVPRRGTFFAAKIVAVLGHLGVSALVTVGAALLTAQVALGQRRADVGEAVPAAIGAWLYLVLIGLFALGVATALRSSTITLGILLPLLLLGSQGLGNLPGVRVVTQFLPDQLGWVVMHLAGPQDDPRWARDYGPWTGLALLAVWTAAALLVGYARLRRRDLGQTP
ncbi:ABC transporter permease [Cryptosporangium aurantiacum]|uniref:ABC-2 type transport system permease protein n=1 Tax=Cryptosporangium aurantiacum TaxID=134849 RepID=A0A1M7QVX7_9ACTN|nr:ABC transporter permease [Cryptosporangium aurantiacum]SHN36144.1 ABC-2 type transport system permease protein [Cryptosporangium aurantiacum]